TTQAHAHTHTHTLTHTNTQTHIPHTLDDHSPYKHLGSDSDTSALLGHSRAAKAEEPGYSRAMSAGEERREEGRRGEEWSGEEWSRVAPQDAGGVKTQVGASLPS